MKKLLNIILKNIGSLVVFVLFLSANTTSGWIAHQPKIPEEVKNLKITIKFSDSFFDSLSLKIKWLYLYY